MNRFSEIYFAIWATCLPIASVLLIPRIQGTTVGNILALASIAWVPFVRRDIARRYVRALSVFAGTWLALVILGQLGLYFFDNPLLPQILRVDALDDTVLLRKSIFTQSLYLFACILSCLFFVFFYKSEWRRYLFWGAWVLAIYGIYEWLFFLATGKPGDFIANRTFLDGEFSGSWSQVITFGRLELLRIKSTTGEPSFLALAGMPYLILAIENKKWALVAALSFCLIFSFSTSAYLSIVLLAVFSLFFFKVWQRRYIPWIAGFALVAVVFVVVFPAIFETVITQKLAGKSSSGYLRQHVYLGAWGYWQSLSLWCEIFGIGFGNAFVTPFLGGLLINTGLVGVTLFLAGFIWPMIKLPNTPENWALKAMLLVLLFMLSVSVADFTYLTTWMTLGLAYRRLRQLDTSSDSRKSTRSEEKRIRRSSRVAPPVTPTAFGEPPQPEALT